MNKRKIISIIGRIILIEAALMIPALVVSLLYGDGDAPAFIVTMIPAVIVGLLFSRVRQSDRRMSSRDGYFIVAAAWIVISLIGAVPLFAAGGFASYWDALLRLFQALPPPERPYWPGLRIWATALSSGAALPTGSGVWECWSSCSW